MVTLGAQRACTRLSILDPGDFRSADERRARAATGQQCSKIDIIHDPLQSVPGWQAR
jgi:hypothetical protein